MANLRVRSSNHSFLASTAYLPSAISGCHVYCSSATSAVGSASTKIAFDTELFDIAGEFASNKFTVTTAGYYFIHLSVCLQDFSDGQALQPRIYKNGSQLQAGRTNNGKTDHMATNVTSVKYLAASDYIEGYVFNGWSTSKNTTTGDNLDTFMTIMRLT